MSEGIGVPFKRLECHFSVAENRHSSVAELECHLKCHCGVPMFGKPPATFGVPSLESYC